MDPTLRTPSVRARAVQDALRRIDEFAEQTSGAVRALVPEATLALIERTSPLGWIPFDHDLHVPTAIIQVLGKERGHAYFRWLMARHLETPLFRSVLTTTRRMFGLTPGSLVRVTPVGWKIAYRDFADVEAAVVESNHAVLRLSDVAEAVFDYPAYLDSFAGIVGGFFDLCAVTGELSTDVQAAKREITFTLDW